MTTVHRLTLLLCAALLTACSHSPSTSSSSWPIPAMELGSERGLPMGTSPCPASGCSQQSVFFKTAQHQPGNPRTYRGW
ncbi:hypothetical protein [Pseudomonas cremoricolorata]|uniref:Lipoprotein n=1 Tax=Pseudomonas cremoricolorata TaxID=157783 RepID=A0A089Y9K8_9PSED|nr:hypothetical protein [Pseudomonas cremoricolorata]AIR88523.1 hypothetical protein LK03_04310 [Pseudomonas cremoricolorata]